MGSKSKSSVLAGVPEQAMSSLIRSLVLLLSFAGLLLGATNANALVCTSVATGNWGVAGTWTSVGNCNRVPTVADTVTIATGHTVTVNVATANVLSVTVNAGAILTQTLALSTAGALSVSGTLTSNNAVTVTGATTVTGNLNTVGAGARTFTGLVTVTGGTWNNSGNRAVTFRGGITNNGTFTAGTGTQTFNTTAVQSIGGANPINFGGIVAVVGAVTVTNNNTNIVTIAGNLTGSVAGSTWVNAANSTLNYGGAAAPMGTRVFTASANPNTVNYNRAGAQTMKQATYYHLTVSGSGTKATGAITLQVNGTTTVTGTATLNISSTTGTKTFVGPVIINAGCSWTNTANELVTFRGGITHNGSTFTGGTGTQTFDITAAQSISGASAINFGGIVAVVGAVTVTNNNTGGVTIAGNLTGSNPNSTWVNAANSTLNYGGAAQPMGTRVFTASAVPNTVNYNRSGAQPIKTPTASTYHHLQLTSAAAGAKTAAAGLTVNGDFTMSGVASFTASTFTHNFAGNWIVNTTAAAPLSVATTSIINFNTPAIPAPTSMGGTTVATIAFADVNINNTSGVTFNDNASFSTGTTPTLTVAAGATLTPAAAVIISGTGTLTGSGTVQVTRTAAVANFASQYTIATKTLTNLTVDYAGAAAQTVSVLTYGSATGGGLKVSNASGVSLTANTTVAGTLTLTSGAVSTGAFILIVSKACNVPSVVRSGGHVAGFLQKNIPVGAPVNCTFEVGDATTYRPINTTFVSVATAGNLVGSVSQGAGEHSQCCGATPFGLDSAKNVNRYWNITNPGGILFTTYSATFNFINPTDFDAGATPANFEVEFWNGAWNITTLGTRTLTSTQAGGIAAFGDFAVGEKKPTNPGAFDAYDTSTTCTPGVSYNCLTGNLRTKIAGTAFTFDIAALNPAKTALFTTFVGPVKVELLDSSDNTGALDATTVCRSTWTTVIQTLANQTFNAAGDLAITGASGRHRVTPTVTENNAWKDVRVRISYPAAAPTVISCATDNFAIRPDNLSVSVTDANWQTAGSTRTLDNSGATGGNAHKAGQPFTISATAQNALGVTTTNYTGSPTVKTLACTLPATCTNGTLTPGAWSGSGTVTTSTASYNEAGAFNLTLEDQIFSSVDNADSTLLERTIPQSAAVAVGRFVPDHFDVAVLITPTFKTFDAADAACSAGAAPRRTFTYIGQPFGYVTVPQATIYARNAAGTTTVNYQGAGAGGLWKVAASDITQTYSNNAVGPALDTSLAGTPTVTDNLNGTGTVAAAAAARLAYQRSTAAPLAVFNANLSLTVSAQDAAENVANQGIITSTTTALFNGTGSGIDFDGGGASNGKEFRYGRLKLSNAYGSELLGLPITIQTQYWNSTIPAFVTNTADNCTSLIPGNINLTSPPAGVTATVGGAFLAGVGSLTLTKPTVPAKVAVALCVDLGADPGVGTVCSATSAVKPYLQGLWAPGSSYDNDPAIRATFGVYKGANEFIYLRENY